MFVASVILDAEHDQVIKLLRILHKSIHGAADVKEKLIRGIVPADTFWQSGYVSIVVAVLISS